IADRSDPGREGSHAAMRRGSVRPVEASALHAVLNPMRAWYWSAMINGSVAVPVHGRHVRLSTRRTVIGALTLPLRLRLLALRRPSPGHVQPRMLVSWLVALQGRA